MILDKECKLKLNYADAITFEMVGPKDKSFYKESNTSKYLEGKFKNKLVYIYQKK